MFWASRSPSSLGKIWGTFWALWLAFCPFKTGGQDLVGVFENWMLWSVKIGSACDFTFSENIPKGQKATLSGQEHPQIFSGLLGQLEAQNIDNHFTSKKNLHERQSFLNGFHFHYCYPLERFCTIIDYMYGFLLQKQSGRKG
ncbi:hypothetical protein K438DRAFT_1759802 [Mycena galopus ATCC 62051]|nr:hypothetical protein K438DRAFT_1759802 [Mycena galopus ATCC 62051]